MEENQDLEISESDIPESSEGPEMDIRLIGTIEANK